MGYQSYIVEPSSEMKFVREDDHSGSKLYLDQKAGEWRLSVKSGDYDLEELGNRNRLSLLPYLNSDTLNLEDLKNLLKSSNPDMPPFPWSKFVDTAFEQGSPHWVFGAMCWLECLPINTITRYHDDLKKVIENKKRYEQKIRQLAFKLMKRMQRLNGR